jgi:hypothetical protein
MLVHGLLELSGQDVAAHIEEGLGGDLQSVLDRPLQHQVALERSSVTGSHASRAW